jgi:hypothetical protein
MSDFEQKAREFQGQVSAEVDRVGAEANKAVQKNKGYIKYVAIGIAVIGLLAFLADLVGII